MTHKLLKFTIFVILTISMTFAGYIIAYQILKADKITLISSIDLLFDNKLSVSDGELFGPNGHFVDERKMNYQLEDGGFKIIRLTNEANGYVKMILTSGDLKYKTAESYWNPPIYSNNPWTGAQEVLMQGFTTSSHRSSISKCYNNAFNFLLKGNKDNPDVSFKPGSFLELNLFPESYSTNYFLVENALHPEEDYFEMDLTSSVYTSEYEISYSGYKNYYQVLPNLKNVRYLKTTMSVGGFILGVVISFVLALIFKGPSLKPEYGKFLLDQRWKSLSDNEVLTFHQTTVGRLKATKVKDNRILNGSAKINDDQLELNFNNSQYLFSIKSLSKDELILTDLVNQTDFIYKPL